MEKKFIEAITGLGSKLKMLFDNKNLEDKKLSKKQNENLVQLHKAVDRVRKAIDTKSNDDIISGLTDIETAIEKQELNVNVEAPIVNVQAPEQKLLPAPESKETITLLKHIFKHLTKQDNGVFVQNASPDAAIPVVLTDPMRRKFYKAVDQILTATSHGVPRDKNGKVPTSPWNYFVEIERGNIASQKIIRLTGSNPNLQENSLETIWDQGGLYIYLISDTQLYASSTSALDTSAITLTVFGLNEDYEEITTTVVLDGQNQVALSGLMFRVHSAVVSGSVDPQGDIYIAELDTLTNGIPNTATKIKAKIIQGNNSTEMPLYTVPAGKTAYGIDSAYLSSRDNDIIFTPLVRFKDGVFISSASFDIYQQSAIFSLNALPVEEKSDIEFRATASNPNVRASVFADLVLIDN